MAGLRVGLRSLGGIGFGGGSQKSPRRGAASMAELQMRERAGFCQFEAGGGAICATAVCSGCGFVAWGCGMVTEIPLWWFERQAGSWVEK